MEKTLAERVRARLADLAESGLTRAPCAPSGVDLSSNDYLGLATHPHVVQRFADAVKAAGCGSTGSRLLRGHRDSFTELERRFTRFKHTERSLYFSSGYLANIAVLTTFPEANDLVYSDERNHASLIDGVRLSRGQHVVFPHSDVTALARLMECDDCTGQRFVVVESLFSMDGDFAPLVEYAALCRRFGAALVADEAHAVGIYGDDGSGCIEGTGVGDDVFLSINTAGKALGVAGAFVAGPTWAIDYLEQRARPFIFSTAPPPALAAALDAALDVIADEPERRERLHSRVRFLRAKLGSAGIAQPSDATQIIPIVMGDNDAAVALADALHAQGFDVRAIRPPTVPAGTARLRVSVNTGLSEDELDCFVSALRHCIEEAERCSAVSS